MQLGARLALVFATVAAATALIVGGASYLTTDRQVTAEIDDFLIERVDEITDGQREQRGNRNDNRRNDEPVEVPPDVFSPDVEVQFLDDDGVVTSSSGSGVALPISSADIELADDDGSDFLRTVDVDGVAYRMITSHINGGGAVQVARSLDESTGLLGVLQTRLLLIAGTVALAAAAVGWIIAQRTTRPLRELTFAVDEVAATGSFTVPVQEHGSDEVGRLASGFNRMLGALQLSQMQQRRLVQDAAHELRTPLTSITANVDLLLHAPDLEATDRSDMLGSVRRELRELNGVISEIIDLATDSREQAAFVPVDLVAVVQDAVEMFRSRTARVVRVAAQPCHVTGDSEALVRTVSNLLNNAHKYSPEGTPIDVEVGDGAVFVNDSGPGIPEEDRPLIFLRFYRRDIDRSKAGSGLGLSIVANIVDHHGGTVHVGDSPSGGACIGFRLPTTS